MENGERNGQGIVSSPDGWRYSGKFKNGKQDGQGKETFPDGRKYEGGFLRIINIGTEQDITKMGKSL